MIRDQIKNPYWAIILLPLLLFIGLVLIDVDPDLISIPARVAIFGAFGYIGVRYVGRAPILMWKQDFSPEARNICGWALSILAAMLQQAYSVVYIAQNRPDYLASLYVAPALTIMLLVGLILVMTSVPRFWPFGGPHGGFSVGASIFFSLLGAGFLSLLEHFPAMFPMAWKAIETFLMGMTHVVR